MLLDNVFASIADGVITTDTDNTITTYNLAAERILGLPREEALGCPLPEALPVLYGYLEDALARVHTQNTQEIVERSSPRCPRGAACGSA